jgi:ATP-dependent helicase/nuclease subunit B
LRSSPCSSNYLAQAVDATRAGRSGTFALVCRGSREAARTRRAILSRIGDGAVFDAPVYTFDQLAAALMRRLDIEPRGKIGDIQRELLVAAALAQCRTMGKLGPLAQGAERPGVARSLAQLFVAMDGAGVDPDGFEGALGAGSGRHCGPCESGSMTANSAALPGTKQGPSAHALDVLEVWRRYYGLLSSMGRAERGRLYSALSERLLSAEGKMRHGLETVRVSGYAWIGGLEASLLSALARSGVDVEIELRCPAEHDGHALAAMEDAVGPAKVIGVELLARPAPPRLIAAAGPTREAREVAREIKRLIVDEKVRPAEICVASADSERFVPLLLEALDEFGVPVTVSRKRMMTESSLVLDCFEVAKLICAGGRRLDIMPLMSSPYVGLGPRLAGQIARDKIGLRGLELSLAGWAKRLGDDDSAGECDALRYIELLAQAVEQAEDARRASAGTRLAGYVEGFRAALACLGMPHRIFSLEGSPGRAVEEWMAWASLHSLLLEIGHAQEVLDASDGSALSSGEGWAEFVSLLTFAAGRRSFALDRPSPHGVEVMGLERAASSDHEFLFMSGLGEQMLPRRRRSPWMLQDGDLQALARAGVSLEPMGNGAEADRHVFNTLVHSRAERIYLSYATTQEDGKVARRSFFVDEHLRSFGLSDADEDEITRVVPASSVFPRRWSDVASKREARMRSLWSIGRACSVGAACGLGRALVAVEPETVLWLSVCDKGFAEIAEAWHERQVLDRTGIEASGHFRGRISCGELLEEMAGIKLDARPWSAHSLNQYIRCPFSYFCRYVLGIEPTDSVGDDVDARDRGTCLHDIAKEFMESHIGEVLDPAKADEYAEEIREIACDVVGRTPSERSGIPESVWDAYFAGIIDASQDFVARELEFAEATSGVWRPAYLEWSFGPRVREFAIGERRVPVTGRIDRIDVGPGGALAIYDYKSGKKAPSAREIKEVADIQLGLYALAAEHLLGAEVAGVWYWQVPSMGRTEGVWKIDYHRDFNAGRKRTGKLDSDEWRAFTELVEEAVCRCDEGARQGMYPPTPSDDACRYCDFPDICGAVELGAGDLPEEGGVEDV